MSAIRRLLIGVLCLATTLEHAALAQGGPSGISQDVLCEVLAPKALPAGSYTQVARWASTDLKHIVGVPTDDAVAAGGRAWEGTASLAAAGGPLLFGPYAAMPAGDYVAFFRIQQTGELGEEAIGAIDACVNGAAGAAIARELGPGDLAQGRYVQVPLAFAMKAGSLECRLPWSATTSIRADTVTLFRRQGPQVPTGPAMVPQPVPTGAPSGLTYRPARPPFAGNFPRSSAPAAALIVCDVENRPTDVQFLAV